MNGDFVLESMLGTGLVAIIGAAILFALLMFIAIYVYTALAIRTIAKKTRVGPTWLAWIPLVNFVLLLKTAKLNWTWIFAVLISIIPIIGSWLVVAGFVFVWWRVCKARHMPEWISLLTMVPFLNLVVMGYVAWSK